MTIGVFNINSANIYFICVFFNFIAGIFEPINITRLCNCCEWHLFYIYENFCFSLLKFMRACDFPLRIARKREGRNIRIIFTCNLF